MSTPIKEVMDSTLEKVKQMADANTIIGDAITMNNITVIPVSRVSYGFGSGGSEFSSKAGKPNFGGGGGGGVTIAPVAMVVINGEHVKVVPVIAAGESGMEKAISLVPEMFEKITALFKKDKKKAEPAE